MLGKLFGLLTLIALICGAACGNIPALGAAVLDGAAKGVDTTLSLVGMMCLWCGMMEVLSEAGAIRFLSRLFAPFLRLFFPRTAESGQGMEEICASISANLLGLGNASTPFALKAMEKIQAINPNPTIAHPEQITLAVLNTSSVTLLPATLLALRRAAGSQQPYRVMLPIWISSFTCAAMALLITSLPRLWESASRSVRGRKHRHD